MTVVLDASALLALHIEGAQRDVVRDMLENDTTRHKISNGDA